MNLEGSDIVVLFVSDLARATVFYRDVLGMQWRHGDERSAVFATEAGMLLLLDHVGADDLLGEGAVDHGARRGATAVLVAAVDDVDRAYEELLAKGVEFIRPPEDRAWGLRTAHLRDLDGNVWELHHDLAPS